MLYRIYLNHLTFKLYDIEDGTLSLFSKCLEFYEFYHVVKYVFSTNAGGFQMYACGFFETFYFAHGFVRYLCTFINLVDEIILQVNVL